MMSALRWASLGALAYLLIGALVAALARRRWRLEGPGPLTWAESAMDLVFWPLVVVMAAVGALATKVYRGPS